MLKDFDVQLGATTERVCFTARARYLFEREAGYPIERLRTFNGGPASDVEIPLLLWSGLEGYRCKARLRRASWTLDEVLDGPLGEMQGDDRLQVLRALLAALEEAFAVRSPAAASSEESPPQGKAPTPTV